MSPRGTRAVHGEEVTASVHGRGGRIDGVLGTPDQEWLVVTCWCERAAVCVPQYDVRWEGLTRSCGRRGCASSDGDATPGVYATSMWAPPAPLRTGEVKTGRPRRSSRIYRRPGLGPLPDDVRRDLVASLFTQRKSPRTIARRLGIDGSVVRDDLLVLYRRGELGGWSASGTAHPTTGAPR